MSCDTEHDLLERLFAEHGQKVFSFCLRLCGNRSDAEDLAAEVFLDAPNSLARFRGESSEETFLYKVALNKHRAQCRAHTRWVARLGSLLAATPDFPKEADLVYDIAFTQALSRLSVKHRQAFLLVKAHGFRYAEAAEMLQVPVGTVQSRVHKACKRMADLLDVQAHSPFAEVRNEV
jgi:RNA polymerase sigma-70 factor (ECF subfamily)